MKFLKFNPFKKIENPVIRKTAIGVVIFLIIISFTTLIRFLNLSGAIIGVFFYSTLIGFSIVEFTSHYGFKKWQQFLLFSVAILIFVFPYEFYSDLLTANGFNPIEYNEVTATQNLPSFLLQTFYNYWIFISIAILTLIFFILNKNFSLKNIPKIFVVIFVLLFFTIFGKFIFLLNFNSYTLFIMIVGGVIFTDSFSYFGGKVLGNKIFKKKLAPYISPNKTIEGAIIGFLGGFIIVISWEYGTNVINNYNYNLDPVAFAISNAIFIPIISILGDLFFSGIKRSLNIKDFSVLFPEHGGIFDRFDSLSFATWLISLTIIFSNILLL